jgi:NADH-quinone oxidoreductase subunit M
VYGLRAAARVFFGPASPEFTKIAAEHPVSDLRWSERLPALILLAALMFIGFWPKSLSTALDATLSPAPAGQVGAAK